MWESWATNFSWRFWWSPKAGPRVCGEAASPGALGGVEAAEEGPVSGAPWARRPPASTEDSVVAKKRHSQCGWGRSLHELNEIVQIHPLVPHLTQGKQYMLIIRAVIYLTNYSRKQSIKKYKKDDTSQDFWRTRKWCQDFQEKIRTWLNLLNWWKSGE